MPMPGQSVTVRNFVVALAALLLLGATDRGHEPIDDFTSHAGELLVADPGMPDPRFRQCVILIVRHGHDGAMGLIVNKTMLEAPLAALFSGLEHGNGDPAHVVAVHYGGPVEPEKGFVLHSREVAVDGTLPIGSDFALSATPAIIEKIDAGKGPRLTLIAFGYAGWGPGQLEAEVAHGDWHWAPATEALVFDRKDAGKWDKALARREIDL
jgi:putative transcriptional regulator